MLAEPKHIIFINRYFYPDHSSTSQILSDLAFALAKRGCRVSVITSRQRYDAPKADLPAAEAIDGVQVVRVPTTRFGRLRLLGRAIDYLTFYLFAAVSLARLARRGSIVVAKTDPPLLSLMAWPVARLRGALLINWLQDLFPEVAEALGVGGRTGRVGFAILRALRTWSLKSADTNVVVGELMAERLIELGVAPSRVVVIPNWADGDGVRPIEHTENTIRQQWGLNGAFAVGYSGNLGRAHDWETILGGIIEVERRLSESPTSIDRPKPNATIAWLFIGSGALMPAFAAAVKEKGLSSVHFLPYQPRERLAESLSAVDVHLVSLRPELEGLVVPSKFYGIAAAGRPTLNVGDGDGEIARIVRRDNAGVTVSLGDVQGFAASILSLWTNSAQRRAMGSSARAAFEAKHDVRHAVARWQTVLGVR